MLGSPALAACEPVSPFVPLPGRSLRVRDPWRVAAFAFIAVMFAIHACAALNLFDAAWIVADGRVEDRWPVAARGKMQ